MGRRLTKAERLAREAELARKRESDELLWAMKDEFRSPFRGDGWFTYGYTVPVGPPCEGVEITGTVALFREVLKERRALAEFLSGGGATVPPETDGDCHLALKLEFFNRTDLNVSLKLDYGHAGKREFSVPAPESPLAVRALGFV